MNCWHCNNQLIWGADFDYRDYGIDEEGIVSNFSCSNEACDVHVEVYLPMGEGNEKKECSCKICHNKVYKVCNCKPVINKKGDQN